jgi:hypothetical protein
VSPASMDSVVDCSSSHEPLHGGAVSSVGRALSSQEAPLCRRVRRGVPRA